MAKSTDKLLPFAFPLKGVDTNWARGNQPQPTTPSALNVWNYDLDLRSRGAKRPGFSVLTGAAVGTVPATYRQARVCTTGSFSGFFIPTTDISSYPYTFSYGGTTPGSGVCYTVLATDPTTTAPSGTIPAAGFRTPVSGCDDVTYCGAPVVPAATYRQMRYCTDGTFAPVWIATAGISAYPAYYRRTSDGRCYSVSSSDPTSTTPGTLIGTKTAFASCVACLPDIAGSANYYRALDCSGATPVDAFIAVADLATYSYTLPYYFLREDHLASPVYIPIGAATTTTPGRIYSPQSKTASVTTGTAFAIESCAAGGCNWYKTLPATIDVTFSAVSMAGSCQSGGGYSTRILAGTLNGTYTLAQTGTCTYEGTVAISQRSYNGGLCDELLPKDDRSTVTVTVQFLASSIAGSPFEIQITVVGTGAAYTENLFFDGTNDFNDPSLTTYHVSNSYTSAGFVGLTSFRLAYNGTATVVL